LLLVLRGGLRILAKYRDRLEIIADILSVVQNGSKKTQVMYQANLSYRLLVDYLDLVMKTGLVCMSDDACYEITDKGQQFLEQCSLFLECKRQLRKHINMVEDVKEKLEELCSPRT